MAAAGLRYTEFSAARAGEQSVVELITGRNHHSVGFGVSVNEQDYQVPSAFNGTIDKLTFHLRPEQLTDREREQIRLAQIRGD